MGRKKTKKVKAPIKMTTLDFKKTDWVGIVATVVVWIAIGYFIVGFVIKIFS